MNKKVNIKKDDNVVVLSGKNRGKKGKVLAVIPKEGKVIVEGVNVVTKHKKPRNQYEKGGLIDQEAPVYVSNVMLVCKKCGKPTRSARKVFEDGSKARVCKKCSEVIDYIKESGE